MHLNPSFSSAAHYNNYYLWLWVGQRMRIENIHFLFVRDSSEHQKYIYRSFHRIHWCRVPWRTLRDDLPFAFIVDCALILFRFFFSPTYRLFYYELILRHLMAMNCAAALTWKMLISGWHRIQHIIINIIHMVTVHLIWIFRCFNSSDSRMWWNACEWASLCVFQLQQKLRKECSLWVYLGTSVRI